MITVAYKHRYLDVFYDGAIVFHRLSPAVSGRTSRYLCNALNLPGHGKYHISTSNEVELVATIQELSKLDMRYKTDPTVGQHLCNRVKALVTQVYQTEVPLNG